MAERKPDASRRSETARRAILDAAAELMGEVGYAKLTIEAIAARAGVGKQTIYRWWPSKGAVVFDAFLTMSQSDGEVELPNTGNLESDFTELLRATVDELNNPRFDVQYRALTTEIQHDPVLAGELVNRLIGPLKDATVDRLASARDAGQVDPDIDLDVAVEMLYGPLYHRWLLRTAPLTHAYADTVADLAVRAMRPGSEPPS